MRKKILFFENRNSLEIFKFTHGPKRGFDIDTRKVKDLVVSRSKVKATTDATAIKNTDYVMICVPTPVIKAKDPDLTPIKSASASVGKKWIVFKDRLK